MNAQDFRIGNFIDHNGQYFKVISLNDNDNWVGLDNYQLNTELEECLPIPLTEEILLKCGFEKDEQWDNTFNKRVDVFNGFTTITIDVRANVLLLDDIEIKLQYLHQLQNLYFALTNQELEIQKL